MKALSIMQPWAYAILHLGKDIENRDWRTGLRGRFLIHAGKGFDLSGYLFITNELGLTLPHRDAIERGGIVGSAVIRDVVRASDSKWFFGEYGFVLQGAQAFDLIPLKGQLGFFDVPDELVAECVRRNLLAP